MSGGFVAFRCNIRSKVQQHKKTPLGRSLCGDTFDDIEHEPQELFYTDFGFPQRNGASRTRVEPATCRFPGEYTSNWATAPFTHTHGPSHNICVTRSPAMAEGPRAYIFSQCPTNACSARRKHLHFLRSSQVTCVWFPPPACLPACSGAKTSRNSIDVQAERSTIDTDSLRGTDRFIKMSTGSFSLTQTKQKCPNTSMKDEPDKIKNWARVTTPSSDFRKEMVPAGLEPATFRYTGLFSWWCRFVWSERIEQSWSKVFAPGKDRTCDLRIMRPTLYRPQALAKMLRLWFKSSKLVLRFPISFCKNATKAVYILFCVVWQLFMTIEHEFDVTHASPGPFLQESKK